MFVFFVFKQKTAYEMRISDWSSDVCSSDLALFFLFPIFWVLLMSFQTNEQILRIPPSLAFEPTVGNYAAIISGKLETAAGTLERSEERRVGKSVSVRVDLGGRSIIKKKQRKEFTYN